MEANIIVGVIFGVLFAIFVIVGSVVRRKATVENLATLPGEHTVFEESGVRVDEKFRGEGIVTMYHKSFVRLTNKRIIIAQVPWFGKKIRYLVSVIYYTGETGPEVGNYGGVFLKGVGASKGYMTFYTTKQHISIEQVKDKHVVKVVVPMKDPGPFLKEPRIFVYTSNIAKYQEVLK
jgi:hypothetical protein